METVKAVCTIVNKVREGNLKRVHYENTYVEKVSFRGQCIEAVHIFRGLTKF